jgi:branched-chain amino acid transport system ATP-binding protein
VRETLRLERLSGGYDSVCVFRDIDVAIEPGETVGIYGANGAGKTTMLLTVMGLLPAISGRVLFNGRDITRMPAYQRARSGLGHVPEGRQVLATLTVRDNLELVRAARLPGEPASAFGRRLDEILDMFPRLRERGEQLAGTLSGGEQQMLAISRALLVNPLLLMLDEPTQGLAPVVIADLEKTLRRLKGRFSIVIVEQNAFFLDVLADRLLKMQGGRCVLAKLQGGGREVSQ